MGLFSNLAKIGLSFVPGGGAVSTALEAGGAMLSRGASTSAHNRGQQMDAQMAEANINDRRRNDFFSQMMQREQEGRASLSDAMRKARQADYLGESKGYTAPAGVPTFGF